MTRRKTVNRVHRDARRKDLTQLIADYRAARQDLLNYEHDLKPGTRVKFKGVQSANWNATVVEMDDASVRSVSADMVYLKFDNGNQFPVAIDELETLRGAK